MSGGRPIRLFSPAKVNWHLRVLKKHRDGYHGLETFFVRLNWGDRITLADRRSGIHIRTSAPIPKGPKNLAYQAAALLRETAAVRRGVEIRIEKRIPAAAGLGGGSSNAAAVLLGLNRLWKLKFSRRKLAKLGARIGSDVPFFVHEAPFAVGRGRGEKITPVRLRRRVWHVIVKPRFGVSTRAAYAEFARLKRSKAAFLTPPRGDVKILLRSLRDGRLDILPNGFFNSLEVVLNKRVIIISKIRKKLLEQGALGALLSGSGSAVFGIFRGETAARRASRAFRRREGYRVFVASTF